MNTDLQHMEQQAEHQGLRERVRIEETIRRLVEAKRRSLEAEAGLAPSPPAHYRRPKERPFTLDQREHTTILFGGFTRRHEHLIEGAWRGLGYRCEALPTPDREACQLGKEYGNVGQCNPAYFTVGNLVKYLQNLEAAGMNRQEIIEHYVFLTAGACGPCRFGMYEAEYRLALRNAGFDGFRVLLFQQSAGLDQSSGKSGLEMNLDFFLGLLNAMNIGDLLNELGFQIRPYEVVSGATERILDEVLADLHSALREETRSQRNAAWKGFCAGTKWEGAITYLLTFIHQLTSQYYLRALQRTRKRFEEIEVDRLRVKPIIKITGEFWAQTTEGDGNFHMFRFLESEGAEVLAEPLGTWILYLLHQYRQMLRDRKGIEREVGALPGWFPGRWLASDLRYVNKQGTMALAEWIFRREYSRCQNALGGILHELADQYELQRMANPFFSSRAEGGEGHLEVAKNIYYHSRDLCHMVLSVKPFGCMPSTQSDGAQAAVVEHYRDMIYLPIETSGDGEINALSRVQMALGDARAKARQEFSNVLAGSGKRLDEIKAFVEDHPELKRPTYRVPRYRGVVGRAANFVVHVAELMDGRAHHPLAR